MESSSRISPEFYVIVRHVVYCIDIIISLLKCTYTKCLYMQKATNIPGSNSVYTDQVVVDKMSKCLEEGTRRQILGIQILPSTC